MVYADAISMFKSEKMYYKVTGTGVYQVTKTEFNSGVAQAKRIEEQNMKAIQNQIALYNANPGISTNAVGPTITTNDGWMEYYVEAVDIGGKYAIAFRFEWLVQPSDTKIDAFGLGHDSNLTKTNDAVYYIYKADYKIYNTLGMQTSSGTYQTQTPTSINVDIGGVAISQDLKDSIIIGGGVGSLGGEFYSNHRGYLQYRVEKNNPLVTIASIAGGYKHQQTTIQVSPSVSYPSFSAGLGVTFGSKFKTMSPNPYLSFSV